MSPALARATAGAVLLLALTACGPQSASQTGAGADSSALTSPAPASSAPVAAPASPASTSASAADAAAGRYVEYATYAANPQTYSAGSVVLFFHADWCPSCRETDKNLTSDPASIPAGLTVVKADFDSETGLREKYGVTVQHTFVQVDAQGKKLAMWTGTTTGSAIAGKLV